MSNQYFNIRFGKYHFVIARDSPYVSLRKNDYWDFTPYSKWFEVYCAFGRHF